MFWMASSATSSSLLPLALRPVVVDIAAICVSFFVFLCFSFTLQKKMGVAHTQ
jgi:hypothetical protein